MKSETKRRRLTAGLIFAAFAAWAFLVARLFVNQGDRLIGFHPVILGIIPGVIVGFCSAVFLLVCRQWQIGTAFGIGALTLLLVLRNGHEIEKQAWWRAIQLHAQTNETAMATIQLDLPGNDSSVIWEDEKLSPLEGFKWYGSNHFSAPNGVYSGFKIGGVPHVRIQKIRNGWRGIALVRSVAEPDALKSRSGLTYSRVGSSDWFTWSF